MSTWKERQGLAHYAANSAPIGRVFKLEPMLNHPECSEPILAQEIGSLWGQKSTHASNAKRVMAA
jgi:hypothetical protein